MPRVGLCWETQRGRYDVAQKKFSLDYKTKGIESRRTLRRLSKVSKAPFNDYLRGPTHNHHKLLCPKKTERLSISPACQTQRIKCVDVKYDDDEI